MIAVASFVFHDYSDEYEYDWWWECIDCGDTVSGFVSEEEAAEDTETHVEECGVGF